MTAHDVVSPDLRVCLLILISKHSQLKELGKGGSQLFALAIPVIACLVAAALTYPVLRLLPRFGGWLLAAVPLTCGAWYLSQAPGVAEGTIPTYALDWMESLNLNIGLRMDGLAVLMSIIITGIGGGIVSYANGYLDGKPSKPFIITWLLVFMAAMVALVNADNLLFAFVSWEATSIASFMLIGTGGAVGRLAARRAMLITGGGGLALLGGLILVAHGAGGVWTFSEVIANVDQLQASPLFVPGLLCVYLGAATKSALFPFHFWLPGAMSAPTPVSAYLHSATMVKAGVFLLARMHPALGGNPTWFYLLTIAGSLTVLWAVFRMLQVKDLKALLAYTTLMVLGSIALLLGSGTEQAVFSALALLLAHAFYKAGMFMVAGSVDHGAGTRDTEVLGGLRKAMPWTAGAAFLVGLAMAGIPPFGGFAAKELMFKAGLENPVLLVVLVLAALAFVFVAWVVAFRPFHSKGEARPGHPHESPPAMLFGMFLVGVVSLLLGIFAGSVDSQLLKPATAAASPVDYAPAHYGFALWHGVGIALFLSIGALIVGFLVGSKAVPLRAKLQGIPRDTGVKIHDALWLKFIGLGRQLTYLIQNGSLRFYTSVSVLTAVVLAGYVLIDNQLIMNPDMMPEMDPVRPLDYAVLVLLVLSTVVMAFSNSRLGTVAALSGVGVGAALFFLLYSAPDLALTQFLVDTLAVVMLVLAFRHLREYGPRRPAITRAVRWVIALSFGAMVTVGVLIAQAVEPLSKVSEIHQAKSVPEAYGQNIVNVILVDFRAFDTMGEITVLGIAAAGVIILLRKVRRGGGPAASASNVFNKVEESSK